MRLGGLLGEVHAFVRENKCEVRCLAAWTVDSVVRYCIGCGLARKPFDTFEPQTGVP